MKLERWHTALEKYRSLEHAIFLIGSLNAILSREYHKMLLKKTLDRFYWLEMVDNWLEHLALLLMADRKDSLILKVISRDLIRLKHMIIFKNGVQVAAGSKPVTWIIERLTISNRRSFVSSVFKRVLKSQIL